MKAILFGMAILLLSVGSNASQITLINRSDSTVEFQVFQGEHPLARVSVPPKGTKELSTTCTAQAFTTINGRTLSSNVVTVSEPGVMLLAQVLTESGYYDFKLEKMDGAAPGTISLENTGAMPVQFKLQRPNTPIQIVTVVDGHSYDEVSTDQPLTVQPVDSGFPTKGVTITDPNSTVTADPNNNDGAISLVVSKSAQAKSSFGCIVNRTPSRLAFHLLLANSVVEDFVVPSSEDICFTLAHSETVHTFEMTDTGNGRSYDESCRILKLKSDEWITVSMGKGDHVSCRISSDSNS